MRNLSRAASVHLILIAYTLIALAPVALVVMNSFKGRKGIFRDPTGLPTAETFSTKGYETVLTKGDFVGETVLTKGDFVGYFSNSLIVTVAALALIILLGAACAHALTEYRFRGSSALSVFMLIGIMVPIRLGTVAILELMVDLSLVNTLAALIFIYTAQGLPLAVFIFSEFMRGVSRDIKDSARIDGLSEYRIFGEVVLPLIRPVIATVAVFSMIPVWNDLWFPLILAPGDEVKTVTLGVQQFIGQYTVDWSAVLAALSLAILPVLVLYAIFSRQLIRGVTAGAVK